MTTTTSNGATGEMFGAIDRFRELNERVLETSKRAGTVYVDATDKVLHSLADYEERLGESAHMPWVAAATHAQADLTRQVVDAYSSTARGLLK